ncbi:MULTISPECIES: winged helix-turn-helix domain-containing protein [Anoxybacillaceae]|uniref:Winged helix-turn-helix domain-containing protein n=1 Tax=Geobacillus proteiniphilus TaxID=860353 RepID=A0ABY9MD36_9BACL|nr:MULTISPECIES: winged helix-turn-helix domain-containing protein [Bacillaceae]MCZ0755687.1 winged helix-turn-helix domain-containing protein [Anoxybacillus sp. J5B_2022]MED3667653.1 winged helix-turn-helix domain-containing protein [Geobacillus kaustophilus]MED4973234.1 winged helix-turn-helix domain-containing protein [Geobacillus thermoleovorans]WMJ15935.1 winged helix-turn-helix domain-containing protein [Geobacillus proteiniphilus]
MYHHYSISISREALRKLLHRKGLSWTRTTYTLAKGDPDRQKNFEKQMDLIKKLNGFGFHPVVHRMKRISGRIMCCVRHCQRLAVKSKCLRSAIMLTYRCLARSTSTMAKRFFIKQGQPMPQRF